MSDSGNRPGGSPVDRWLDLWEQSDEQPSVDQFLEANPDLSLRRATDILLVDQQMRWRDRSGPRVDEYLERFPQVAGDAESVLDLIVGELRASERLGIPISGEAMSLRYPDFSDEIIKQLELASWIDGESSDATAQAAPIWHQLRPGTVFGDYELLDQIAGGGMGSVFKAKHRVVQRIVALKVLSPDRMASDSDRQRFRNESTTVAKLDHPNIMPIYEVGKVDQLPYFTTRLVRPGSLEHHAHVVGESPLRIAETVKQIGDALQYAHQHGVLHRDLKPSNVLVDQQGTPYVCDFGLARIMGDGTRLTSTGEFLGTPVWMPPELVDPKGSEPTVASDVYGLGAILYFLLTGRPPHQGDTVAETLTSIREEDPSPLRSINPAIPRDLNVICSRAMDRSPFRRYASAAAMSEDLGRFLLGEPIMARPLPWWEVERRRVLRHPVRSTVFVAGIIILVATAAYTAKLSRLDEQLTRLVDEAAIAHSDAVFLRSTASQANEEATQLRDEATAIRDVAATAQSEHRALRYAAHMRLAWQAWEDGDARQADSLLRLHGVQDDASDLRGLEWHLLHRRVRTTSRDFVTKSGEARAVALATEPAVMAIGTSLGAVELMDVNSGQLLDSILTGLGTLSRIQITPDAQRLVALSVSGTVALIDRSDHGSEVQRLESESPCLDILVLEAGARLLSTHRDATLRQWSSEGKEISRVELEKGAAARLAASGDQRRIALAINQTMEIRDATTFELLRSHALDQDGPRISDVALSHDGNRCAFGRYSSDLVVLDFATDQNRQVLGLRLLDYPRAVALSADGQVVAACDYGGTIHVLDVGSPDNSSDGYVQLRTQAHEGRGYALKFMAGDKEVVSAGHDGRVRVWPIKDRKDVDLLQLPINTACDCAPAMMPDASMVLVGPDGMIHVDGDSAEFTRLPNDIPHLVVDISSDGRVLASGDKTLRKIEVREFANGNLGAALWRMEDHRSDQLVFSPDDQRLAVVDWKNDAVLILQSKTGLEITRLPARQCFAAVWSPDGGQIAFTVMDDVHVAETINWKTKHVLRGHNSTATMVAWSPDGKAIASTSNDRSVCLWDAESGARRNRLLGHRTEAHWVIFSPDSRTLLSSDSDGVIKMWHVATGELIGDLWHPSQRSPVAMAFSHQGDRLAAVNRHGSFVRILTEFER